MKVTKEMHNRELQSGYGMMKFTSGLLMNKFGVGMLNRVSAKSKGKNIDGLHCEERYIPSSNGGPDIRVRIFAPLDAKEDLPGMLYVHGGGLVLGVPEDYLDFVKNFIAAKPCIVVAPDYRKAFDTPYPAAFNDCYDTLLWMNTEIKNLGIIPDKLIVAGHSAGGGIAAAVVIKARDTQDVKIAFQMPVYPMLDDRQNTHSTKDNNSAAWSARSSKMGWDAYLKNLRKERKETPVYASAARETNFSDLPPAISFVGDLEPFYDETVSFMESLQKAGVPVKFQVFKGCYHAFEVYRPDAEISKSASKFLKDAFVEYIDRYIYS